MSVAVETAVALIDVVGMIGSGCYYYSYVKDSPSPPEEPNIIMKCLFPGCVVCAHQGADNPKDILGVCCFGSFFTVLCWEPNNSGGGKVYATT